VRDEARLDGGRDKPAHPRVPLAGRVLPARRPRTATGACVGSGGNVKRKMRWLEMQGAGVQCIE